MESAIVAIFEAQTEGPGLGSQAVGREPSRAAGREGVEREWRFGWDPGPLHRPDGLPEREGSKSFPSLRFLLMQQCGLKSYLKNKLFHP